MSTVVAKKTTTTASRTVNVPLAPPFRAPWQRVESNDPKGFWGHAHHTDHSGELIVQMGRNLSNPQAPQHIGYYGAGWQRQRYFQGDGAIVSTVFPSSVIIQPNGGVMVPWGYLEVKGPGGTCWDARRLHPNTYTYLSCPIDDPGHYTVATGVYFRGVFQGNADPYGEVFARITSLKFLHYRDPFQPLERTLAGGPNEEALYSEDEEINLQDLLEMMASSSTTEVPSLQQAARGKKRRKRNGSR